MKYVYKLNPSHDSIVPVIGWYKDILGLTVADEWTIVVDPVNVADILEATHRDFSTIRYNKNTSSFSVTGTPVSRMIPVSKVDDFLKQAIDRLNDTKTFRQT